MKEKKITRIRDVIAKYPKGEIPKIYNERIVEIIIKLLPNIEERIILFDEFIRINRIFGKSKICDENDKILVKLESRNGVILKAYVQTIIHDKNGVAGIVERSILNDSIALRNTEKNNKKENSEC